jgi:hypothetical protein
MLAACRALSTGSPGIICILGTGSNSCVFDGNRIIQQIPSLGFPLGDEGSGADIGRACVRGFYYGLMPVEIRETFARVLPHDRAHFLSEYTMHPAKNAYLAGLVPLLKDHVDTPFVGTILHECFCTFTRLHVTPYGVSYPVHFVGSIAAVFQKALRKR